ncbi:hypothetical protein NDK47_26405 [Brevibacillus ruminantium]|uniref:Uncharacterized protein n=1 Tax=Brevibacillus ruminantium TaxID=2950604 RepID=A0ABY4WIB9_9BACL|nr:hypothetical protein [Brevibacillus ruminantium]USG65590.1 hypothetical protein NDK47_26405 [Brevibacillus ruminantium]
MSLRGHSKVAALFPATRRSAELGYAVAPQGNMILLRTYCSLLAFIMMESRI